MQMRTLKQFLTKSLKLTNDSKAVFVTHIEINSSVSCYSNMEILNGNIYRSRDGYSLRITNIYQDIAFQSCTIKIEKRTVDMA